MLQTADEKNIMVIGSTCVDIIINIEHLPKTEEDIHPTSQTLALGGCAFNVASMCRMFHAPVTLVSPVGMGFYGEYVAKELKNRGFESRIHVPDQDNGCCYCLVETGGERTFMSYHGAEYTFNKSWMNAYETEQYEMVYVCGLEIEEPTGIELIEYLEAYPNREIFYAPGPRGANIPKEKTKRIYGLHPVLHINESEASTLSGCSQMEDAAKRLMAMTDNTVVITLGEKGTYCLEKNGSAYLIEGNKVNVTDTIGAGDAHIGAFMAALSRGKSCEQSIRIANKAAAVVVGIRGATLTREEFEQIFSRGI